MNELPICNECGQPSLNDDFCSQDCRLASETKRDIAEALRHKSTCRALWCAHWAHPQIVIDRLWSTKHPDKRLIHSLRADDPKSRQYLDDYLSAGFITARQHATYTAELRLAE